MNLGNLKIWTSGALATMAVMLTANAQAETVTARAQMIRVDDSPIGQALHLPVCEWRDPAVPPKAIIFAIHGATLYAKTFDSVANHFASEGYPVYALDMRGFGRWRSESNTFGGDSAIHYTQTKEDMSEVLGMLRRTYPKLNIYCMGESLGANMALWLVSNKPELADGAILSSPCIKRVFHPRPRLVVDFAKGWMAPYKPYDMKPHIQPYLSDDERVTAEYLNDPMINRNLSAADLIKSMRTNAEALKGSDKMPENMPLLVVAGKKDQIYKAAAIEPFMKKVGSQKKTVFIEPDKGHLLLESNYTDPKVLKEIDDWLAEEVSQKDKIVRAPDVSSQATNESN